MNLCGVILAGGTGSRLMPLTKSVNKSLLPVAGKPMIQHVVEKMVEGGVANILVITGTEHAGDIINHLGSGNDYDCILTYRVQERSLGIAHALTSAHGFVKDCCCVILGDNIFPESLRPYVGEYMRQGFEKFKKEEPIGAMLVLKKVPDPRRLGVAEVSDGKIVSIEEKPEFPKSDLAITGIYFYDSSLFEYMASLKPSARGEYEITDVSRKYMEAGTLEYQIMEGEWIDAGTHESLRKANEIMFLEKEKGKSG